jgi:hypothetical protein
MDILKKYEYLYDTFAIYGETTIEEIQRAEKLIRFEFPKSLKEFWLEMGYGRLYKTKDKVLDLDNDILSPHAIAQTILRTEEAAIIDYVLEDYLQEGDVPFFHVSNSDEFLKFRLKSDKPDAIYHMGNYLIEESFEKFIWRLYHESPDYYNQVILDKIEEIERRHQSQTK